MPQWKDVDVNFRGSGSAIGDALQSVNAAANIPRQLLNDREAQRRYEAEQARHVLERTQDVKFREDEAKRTADQFSKTFGLQQSAEDRAKAEQAAKENTRQGYGKFGELLSQPNLTETQASRINEMAAKGIAPEKLLKEVEKAHTLNKGSLTQQRQLLAEQAPVRELYDVVRNPVTGEESVRTRGDLDIAQQQAMKEQLLGNLDRRIEADANRAQQLQLHRESEAAANRRHKESLRAQTEKPVTLYKTDAQGNIVYTQARNNAELQALTTKGGWNLGGSIDRAPVSKSTIPELFGTSKESTGLDLDAFGTEDTQQARLLGQRLQNAYKLKPEQVNNILQQSIGRTYKSAGMDRYIDPDKLADALLNAGAASTKTGAINTAKTLLAEPNN